MGTFAVMLGLITCALADDDERGFSAQAVLWRDSGDARGDFWTVCLLLRNESDRRVEVPRVPDAYNTEYPIPWKKGPPRSSGGHYDCYVADYPDQYVTLAPKEVHVWQLEIKPAKEIADKELLEMVVSASFDAYIDGKRVKRSVECFLSARLKPTPHEWLERHILRASDAGAGYPEDAGAAASPEK